MYRRVDHGDARPPASKSLGAALAAVGRTVVHHPEDAGSGAIRLLGHHLGYQTVEAGNASLLLTAAVDLRPSNVPGREVRPRALALILVFHPHGFADSRWGSGMAALAGLDAGLLVGREDAIAGTERGALPEAFVQVQHPPRFLHELGVPGEDPAAVSPRADGIFGQPAPKRGLPDRGH